MRNGLLGLAVMMSAACSPDDGRKAATPTAAPVVADGQSRDPYSNILREDYVGPEACGKCHQDNYARWKQHPHSRMNALADAGSVLGDFSDARLPYADGEAFFRKRDGQYSMEYHRQGTKVRTFKVTRTIGWRYLQEYVGVQTEGPEPPGDALYQAETRLKFGYLLKDKRWVPQSYLDLPDDGTEYKEDGRLRYDPFEPERTPFNNRCIHCHNTFPYELRLYTSERLLGFPPAPLRAIDALLKARPEHLNQRSNNSLPTKSLVSVGISCESCHFGGREHAKDPKKPIRFVPTHPELAGWMPDRPQARKDPAVVNALCRQCHFSGESSWADGSAVINSMESIELDRGACLSKISCTSCHNPHVRGPDAGADRKDAGASCLACHAKYQAPGAAKAHGRHDPAAASCLDCHMPRIVHGFDAINRTHRISSPSEPEVLASGMANACNLCHLDRSLAWTRDEIGRGWGKRVQLPAYLEEFFGKDHSTPAGEAWLAQPHGILRVVAGAAYARSPLGTKELRRLLKLLDEPNAYLRARALQNVEQLLGRKLEEDEFILTGSPARRREQVERLLKKYSE